MNLRSLISVLFVFLAGCSFAPGKKTVVEDTFIEPITFEQREEVWEEIAELRDQIQDDYDNADLHRRLAVLYRLAGTPRSRLLSIKEIDKAIELNPRNPRNYIEKGLTMLARRFMGEAEACFNRATELDPKYFEGWYQLGYMEQKEYMKTMCFPEHLKKSLRYYQKAHRVNRKDEDTLFRLSFLHIFRSMFKTARKYARKAIIAAPENPRNHLLLGAIYYHLKKFEEAHGEFSKAFELMNDSERGRYEDISPLLSGDTKELYLTSTIEKKRDWNRKFWIENDPTPSTEANERLLEHYKRVFLSQQLFTDPFLNLEGDDTDRGSALIRFGLPHKKFYDLGSGMVGAWVVWRYEFPDYSFNLYFHDEFLNGNFHFPIADRTYGEGSIHLMKNVPQSYEFPIKYRNLPIRAEAAQFRGADDRTRLEISIAIPEPVLKMKKGKWNLLMTLFDSEWNRIFREQIAFKPDSLISIKKLYEDLMVYTFWVELLPRPLGCTCFIELVNDVTKDKGTWKYPFEIRNLYGRNLKLSNIKLTIPGKDRLCTGVLDPVPVYRNSEALCLTYQIYNLKKNESNQARYRLTYMIKSPGEEYDGSESSFRKTLSYMWSTITGKKDEEAPYISSTIEQSINQSMATDNLQIDLEALERGMYLLALRVEDLNSGEEIFEEKIFTVSD